MKKRTFLILAVFLFVLLSSGASGRKSPEAGKKLAEVIMEAAAAIEAQLPAKTEIVIAEIRASPANLVSYLDKELDNRITLNGKLTILARGETLDSLLKEQDFQTSGFVSDKEIVGVGKMLGADSMVFGEFDDLGAFFQYRIRVVEVKTAAVQASYNGRVTKDDSDIAVLLGNRGSTSSKSIQETAIAHYNRGIDNYSAGVYDPAINEFNQAIKINSKFVAAFLRRGVAYAAQGNWDKAISDFTTVIKLDKNNSLAYVNRGSVYFNATKGDMNKALADYTQAIAIDPNYMLAYAYRGLTYRQLKNYDYAIADFTSAIRIRPNDTSLYYERAEIYYNVKKDFDRAVADITRIIQLKPRDTYAYYVRGDMYHDMIDEYRSKRDYDKAIADFTSIIAIDPKDPHAYYARGRVYYDKDDFNRAIADWAETVRLDPNYIEAYFGRGLIFHNNLKDYDRAIAEYTKAIGINKERETSYSRHYFLLFNEFKDDQVSLSRGTIHASVGFDTSLQSLYRRRGYSYINKGDYDKAIADLNQAIRLDPKNVDAYINRGIAYLNLGNAVPWGEVELHKIVEYEKAIADFTQAIKLDPKNARIYYYRAVVHERRFELQDAVNDCKAALRIDPNYLPAKELKEHIEAWW